MKIGKLIGALFLTAMIVINACQKQDSDSQVAERYFKSLKENEARILVKIDGKEFYPSESVFTGQILMDNNILSLTLTDQFEGKTIINITGEKWYEQKPVKQNITENNPGGTSLKIGKIIDRKNMIGEGYMMTGGEIAAPLFSKDKMIFKINGKVGKYSDFQQPDKYLPFEGLIVYKKPAFSLGNITEKEAFSSTIPE